MYAACLSAYVLTYIHTCLPGCLPGCLSVCLSVCLSACLPACLPDCLIQTGVEATAALRSPDIAYPNLIIGITGNALSDDVTAFLAAGADMVLAKPMRPAYLQHLLAYISSHGKRSNPGFKLSMGAEGVIRRPVDPGPSSQQDHRRQQQNVRQAENV